MRCRRRVCLPQSARWRPRTAQPPGEARAPPRLPQEGGPADTLTCRGAPSIRREGASAFEAARRGTG